MSNSSRSWANIGLTAIAIFFLAGAVICLWTMLALAFPSTPLDVLWQLKPSSKTSFEAMGWGAYALLAPLAVVLVATALGLLARNRWAYWVTVVLFAVNAVPEIGALFAGEWASLVPVLIIAALIGYLFTPPVRRAFRAGRLNA